MVCHVLNSYSVQSLQNSLSSVHNILLFIFCIEEQSKYLYYNIRLELYLDVEDPPMDANCNHPYTSEATTKTNFMQTEANRWIPLLCTGEVAEVVNVGQLFTNLGDQVSGDNSKLY